MLASLRTYLLFLVTVLCPANGQRTFMRTCECEYVSNGKCAYTILLPIGNDAAAVTCEKERSQSSGSSTIPTSELAWIQSQLADVRLNVTDLQEWSASQARLLSQMQGVIIDLQARIVTSCSPTTGDDVSGSGSPNSISLDQIKKITDNLSSNVEALTASQSAVAKDMSSLNVILTDTIKRMHAVQEQITKVSATVTSNQDAIASLESQIRDIKKRMCAQRGLLVSGDEASIPDENITASSQFNENHGPMRVRINNTLAPGAWCPQEPNMAYEWIQFDLGREQLLFGTVSKGRFDFEQWVTEYRVEYAVASEPLQWNDVNDVTGVAEIFPGNHDKNSIQINIFWTPVKASLIRIIPIHSYNDANKCMRADIIGCLDERL